MFMNNTEVIILLVMVIIFLSYVIWVLKHPKKVDTPELASLEPWMTINERRMIATYDAEKAQQKIRADDWPCQVRWRFAKDYAVHGDEAVVHHCKFSGEHRFHMCQCGHTTAGLLNLSEEMGNNETEIPLY